MSDYSEGVITFGMTCDDLSAGLGEFYYAATSRICGPGRVEYEQRDKNGNPFQAFEQMTPRELLQMAREEVQDLGVYAAMLDIRLARMDAALKANEVIGDAR